MNGLFQWIVWELSYRRVMDSFMFRKNGILVSWIQILTAMAICRNFDNRPMNHRFSAVISWDNFWNWFVVTAASHNWSQQRTEDCQAKIPIQVINGWAFAGLYLRVLISLGNLNFPQRQCGRHLIYWSTGYLIKSSNRVIECCFARGGQIFVYRWAATNKCCSNSLSLYLMSRVSYPLVNGNLLGNRSCEWYPSRFTFHVRLIDWLGYGGHRLLKCFLCSRDTVRDSQIQ